MNSFSERFKQARERSGLSLAKIAERVGVSTQAVWNYENRPDGSVSTELLFPVADALGVDARWLATGHGLMIDGDAPAFQAQRLAKVAASLSVLTDEKLNALSVLLGIKL